MPGLIFWLSVAYQECLNSKDSLYHSTAFSNQVFFMAKIIPEEILRIFLWNESLYYYSHWLGGNLKLLQESTSTDRKWLEIAFSIANCHFRLPICNLKRCFNAYRSTLLDTCDSLRLPPIRCVSSNNHCNSKIFCFYDILRFSKISEKSTHIKHTDPLRHVFIYTCKMIHRDKSNWFSVVHQQRTSWPLPRREWWTRIILDMAILTSYANTCLQF